MHIVFELIKAVLPEFIAGICGFLIARYTYLNGGPTKNLDIAFDKIYYPLYCVVKNETDYSMVIKQVEMRLSKYYKFANNTTFKAYEMVTKEKNDKNRKKCFMLLKDDIYENYYKCRKRLGYLSPGIMSGYKFMSLNDKVAFGIWMSSLGVLFGLLVNDILRIFGISGTWGESISLVSLVLVFMLACVYGGIKLFVSIRMILVDAVDKISKIFMKSKG